MTSTLRRPALAALLLAAWWGVSAPAGAQVKQRERPQPAEPPQENLDRPPPPAPGEGAVSSGVRWEYHVLPFRAGQRERELQHALNELGEQGWELAGTAVRVYTNSAREKDS